MKVALAQISPVLLDRSRTLAKVVGSVEEAGRRGAGLVAFGETLVPAYPIWLSRTDAARFDAPDQKDLHALYLQQSVRLGVVGGANDSAGDLSEVAAAAKRFSIAVVLGVAERGVDRGDHSIFCSRVFIGPDGRVLSVHRKLMPTYEERLSWAAGDGAGLVVHPVGEFTVGALNCWENWMPLARTALYAQGENLHVALWPGCQRNTQDITRFIAFESRSFVLSVSSIIRDQDIPPNLPSRPAYSAEGEIHYDGGSCIANPDGTWLIPPIVDREELIFADLDLARVHEERQNFDPTGHYSRPDVLQLTVDRRRQRAATFLD